MLVLTRKTGQKLIIANNVEITILETKGESVKLGINAPRSVSVYREEIYQEIRRANELATQPIQTADLDQLQNWAQNRGEATGQERRWTEAEEPPPAGSDEPLSR